ncbi:MAG: BLUF domain-containing protein [Hymenobacter sp.]
MPLDEAMLLHLLEQCRPGNEQNGITGVLMYGGGQFIQVLEGCPAAVRRLYARIAADPRHGRLEILADGPVPRREFKNWHMSFLRRCPLVTFRVCLATSRPRNWCWPLPAHPCSWWY